MKRTIKLHKTKTLKETLHGYFEEEKYAMHVKSVYKSTLHRVLYDQMSTSMRFLLPSLILLV